MLLGMRSPKVGPTPVGAWRASTSTLAQLAALVSHSRTSLATMFDSTGKLTYAPNNLLRYSNTFSNAAWTKGSVTLTSGVSDPLGGSNAWTMTATGVAGTIYEAVTISAGTTTKFLWSIWIKRRTGTGEIRLYNPDNTTTPNVPVTSSWAQYYVVTYGYNATTAFPGVIVMTSGDAVDIYLGTLSAVTYETTPRTADQVITTSSAYYGPRIDYDPNTLAVKGLLIEEARTNLAIQSTLASGWSVYNVTATTDATKGSDGTTASTKLTATAATAQEYLYRPAMGPTATGTAFTLSIETDGSSGAFPFLSIAGDTGNNLSAVFDITTAADGTATQTQNTGSGSLASTSQKYLGGGRYRLSVTGQVGSIANPFAFFGLAKNKTGNTIGAFGAPSGTFAGTEYVYFTFVQFEAGSFATSYIPDAAAAVTRAADALAAALYSSNPSILQVRNLSTGVRSRKKLTTFSSVSSELNEWIEAFRVYPVGTSSAYLDAHLTVDGSW